MNEVDNKFSANLVYLKTHAIWLGKFVNIKRLRSMIEHAIPKMIFYGLQLGTYSSCIGLKCQSPWLHKEAIRRSIIFKRRVDLYG